MEVECGKVLIELNPNISPKAVNRFKKLINKGSYNGSAFYRVIENTLIQAGDIEYGNVSNLNYSKVGTGKSGLGTIKSELSDNFLFNAGSVAFARKDQFDTEDSEFFITLIDIIYDRKIPIAVTAEKNLDKFNSSKSLKEPFKRTISRLYELTSSKLNL